MKPRIATVTSTFRYMLASDQRWQMLRRYATDSGYRRGTRKELRAAQEAAQGGK